MKSNSSPWECRGVPRRRSCEAAGRTGRWDPSGGGWRRGSGSAGAISTPPPPGRTRRRESAPRPPSCAADGASTSPSASTAPPAPPPRLERLATRRLRAGTSGILQKTRTESQPRHVGSGPAELNRRRRRLAAANRRPRRPATTKSASNSMKCLASLPTTDCKRPVPSPRPGSTTAPPIDSFAQLSKHRLN